MQDALKRLKEDEFIMVLSADKERASVVMDTNTYHTKMPTLIENGLYQLLNKDPTERMTRKLSEKLLTLKRSGYSSEAVYNKIRPRHKQFTEDSQGRCTLKTYYPPSAARLS